MKMSSSRLSIFGVFSIGFAFLFLTGCMTGVDAPTTDSLTPQKSVSGSQSVSELETSKKSLFSGGSFKINSKALAFSFGASNDLTHGVGGDRRFVFYTEALSARRVVVLSRITGHEIAALPQPPGGFILPFSIKMVGPGRVLVLDAGGFPSPTVQAIPRLYEYTYSWNHQTHTFSANLVRTVKVENVPFGFSEGIVRLPDGRYLISDSILGQILIINTDGTYVPGIAPASLAPQDRIPQLGPCLFPANVVVDGIPFVPPGGFSPGAGDMVAHQGYLYFNTSCGGLHKVPLSVFSDSRLPHERAADITLVSARPANQAQDTLKGLTFNQYRSNDNWLYAVAPFQLGVLRINVSTGAREWIMKDTNLFNFPVAAQFLPPLFPGAPAPLIVASDQEHRFAGINSTLTENQFILPFRLTKVFLKCN